MVRSLRLDVVMIRERLRRRGMAGGGAILVELLIGLPLSLVGPLVMAMFFWATMVAGFQIGLPFWRVFGVSVLVMVPLEYWTEMRTHGNFLEEAIGGGRAVSSGAGYSQVLRDFAVATGVSQGSLFYTHSGGADPAGIVEMMLWGPRQVLTAFHQWRLVRRFRGIDLVRESRIMGQLLAVNHGVSFSQLMVGGEERADFVRAIAYLAYYEWVGVSENEDKVWALSDAREDFA